MKIVPATIVFIVMCTIAVAQSPAVPRNIFIITTDGLRWQEVFTGADSALLHNPSHVRDTSILAQQYWDTTGGLRRQKLMPFFWNVIAKKGQLYGNRLLNSKVDVANFYKISYPGYNEIFTGYADNRFLPNIPVANSNTNILEFLNQQKEYAGKVVAFGSWTIFPYILNENRSKFPVNSGYENLDESDSTNTLINKLQEGVASKNNTRHDDLTYAGAKEYIEQNHPKVAFIGFGETDHFAHQGKYDMYLQRANDVDRMIAELWYYVQTDPFYKNNTLFIITTDHGRGSKPSTWWTHSFLTKGSGEAWLAVLGPDIAPMGEMKDSPKIYQKQIAATVAMLLDEHFEANHPVAKPISLPISKDHDRMMVASLNSMLK